MNRYSSLLLSGALAGSLAACGSSDQQPPPAPVNSGTDTPAVTTDAGGDGGVVTDSGPTTGDGGAVHCLTGCYCVAGSAPACPPGHVANSPTQPSFRITQLNITAPTVLANALILGTVNSSVKSGGFLWGISLDLTANTFRTGPLRGNYVHGTLGRGTAAAATYGLIDGTFSYFAGNAPTPGAVTRYDPASGTLTMTGTRYNTNMLTTPVLLPVFNTDGTLLTALPLNNVRLHDIPLEADRGCIGVARFSGPAPTRFDECRDDQWAVDDPMMRYAVLEADMTVMDTEGIQVSALNADLCSIIAVPPAGMTCATAPMAMWHNQPTTMVGALPAFHLVSNIAAIAANITNAH